MKLIADLHTHTLVSQHAYSTIKEMVLAAKEKGFLAIGVTDHGPALPDGAKELHFVCLRDIPDMIEGVRFIRGIEANIMDYRGTLDLTKRILSNIDFCIASYHIEVIKHSTFENHTAGLIAALNNPGVNCLGHIGNPAFKCDYEAVIKECSRLGKCVEINSNSFRVREGSKPNCQEVACLCKKYHVPVLVNSDAHSCFSVGDFDAALDLLNEIDFPEDLVINADYTRLMNYIFKNKPERIY